MKTTIMEIVVIVLSVMSPLLAWSGDFHVSGFASVVAGAVLDGNYREPLADNPDVKCPCAVTDWANNGFYEGSAWTTKPDTKAGIQLSYFMTDDLFMTGQLVSRGVEPEPDITWAYVSYKFYDHWQLDVGRKRVPLYYYSDFQDIGVAYPWITPPGELYGWEATNYNGASIRYRNSWNEIDISASAFTGRESVKDNPYGETWANYRVDSLWDNMLGGDIEFSKDWWMVRLVYVTADVIWKYPPDPGNAYTEYEDLTAYGIAFNADFGDWFVLSEAGNNVRDTTRSSDSHRLQAPAASVGVGYRFGGKWTAFINYGVYKEIHEPSSSDDEVWRFHTTTLTLRYDLTPSSDIKIQFDAHNDDSRTYDADYINLTNEHTGNTQLLRVSYDIVF